MARGETLARAQGGVKRWIAEKRVGSRAGAMLFISSGLFAISHGIIDFSSVPGEHRAMTAALSSGVLGLVAGISLLRGWKGGTRAGIVAFSILLLLSGGSLAAIGVCGAREGAPVGFLVAAFAVALVMLPLLVIEMRNAKTSSFNHVGRHEG